MRPTPTAASSMPNNIAPLANPSNPRERRNQMHNKTSDAELVAFLKVVEKHQGSASAAGLAIGKSASMGRTLAIDAKARGLTAQTVIRDPLEKARTEISALKEQVKTLEREEETAAAI